MIGAIRTRDIVSHPLVTVQCFGWSTLVRALLAGNHQTFLSLLEDTGKLCPADPEVTAVLNQCVDLELRAEDIYLTLAGTLAEEPAASLFFATLAQQEQSHAELLRLCTAASRKSGLWLGVLLAWREDLIRLDEEMREAETILPTITDLDSAMRLMIQVELSEVNRIFLAAMKASNSDFVKKLQPFKKAIETHINYISSQLAVLTPHLSFERQEEEAACSADG